MNSSSRKWKVSFVLVSSQGYSTLPGYGKDNARPITVWKGNSMMTIAVRDPQISGKDSGKGDSDVNDSDSDISEGLKKDYTSYKGQSQLIWCTYMHGTITYIYIFIQTQIYSIYVMAQDHGVMWICQANFELFCSYGTEMLRLMSCWLDWFTSRSVLIHFYCNLVKR